MRASASPQCGRVLSLFNSFLALAGWALCLKRFFLKKKKHGLLSKYDYHSRLNVNIIGWDGWWDLYEHLMNT